MIWKGVHICLNKYKINTKRDENKTLQQDPHQHKYIRSISNVNFKLNRNVDIAKTEEMLINSEQDRKIGRNLSIKDRIFGSGFTSKRNMKVNYITHKTTPKKNENGNNVYGNSFHRSKIAKKKLLMLHHKLNSFDKNDNLFIQFPLTCSRNKNDNENDNMISFKKTNYFHKPKVFEFHRQMSMKNYMSKNDFYYS